MAKESVLKISGTITEVLPNTTYRVKLETGTEIFAYTSGKMRQHNIKILLGDQVSLELSPYDLTKGRIVYRK